MAHRTATTERRPARFVLAQTAIMLLAEVSPMNKEYLSKNVGRVVRLRPPATTPDGQRLDVDWRIVNVTDTRAELRRITDDATLRLGLDHVHRYSSDPDRDDEPNAPYGYLVLTENVVRGDDGRFRIEPVIPGDRERRLASNPAYSPEIFREAQAQYDNLNEVLREAVKRVLLVDQMTDAQMKKYLSEKGLAHGLKTALEQLSHQTQLVQRVLPERQPGEGADGYQRPYKINPAFRSALMDVIAGC
jgi:hypothetical protein